MCVHVLTLTPLPSFFLLLRAPQMDSIEAATEDIIQVRGDFTLISRNHKQNFYRTSTEPGRPRQWRDPTNHRSHGQHRRLGLLALSAGLHRLQLGLNDNSSLQKRIISLRQTIHIPGLLVCLSTGGSRSSRASPVHDWKYGLMPGSQRQTQTERYRDHEQNVRS